MRNSGKLLSGTLITAGGASLLVGGVLLSQSSPTAPNAVASPAVNTPNGVDALYTPSKYPGVMVRNVPAPAAKSGRQKGWIYLKPGAKPSSIKRRYGTRGGVTYEAGKTSAGGTIAHVSPDFYPYAVARLKPNGKVHVEEVNPWRGGQPAPPAKPQSHVEIQY